MIYYLIRRRSNPEYYISIDPKNDIDPYVSISIINVTHEIDLWHRSSGYSPEKPMYYLNKYEFAKIYT